MPKLKKISIPISFETDPKQKMDLVAYLFDRSDKLIRRAIVKKNAIEAELEEEFSLREVRLVITSDIKRRGPDIDHRTCADAPIAVQRNAAG